MKRSVKSKARVRADVLESSIEDALEPNCYVSEGYCSDFVAGLENVEEKIAELIDKDSGRASSLYETFIAGCFERFEDVDDEGGEFGVFIEGLFCGWVKARQAAGTDSKETAAQLSVWMREDQYDFFSENEIIKVLDKPGLAAFEQVARAEFDSAASSRRKSVSNLESYERERWSKVLRAIYLFRKDLDAYISFCEEAGLTGDDCEAVATLLEARRRYDEALTWVERGIGIKAEDPHNYSDDLVRLKRRLLTKVGRGKEAVEAAWSEYCKHPSSYSYDELMSYVQKDEKAAWHEKAVKAAGKGRLDDRIELLLHMKEMERLAEVVRRAEDEALEDISHYVTEPAAEKLEKAYPEVAARLWSAQGMRILDSAKSKYYRAALRNFKSAKLCWEKAGRPDEWNRVVDEVRSCHSRKYGFMPGFEALAKGGGQKPEPTFLQRAKKKWKLRTAR